MEHPKNYHIDPKSGFNPLTKTFHSLRPPLDLPPEHTPLSASEFSLSLFSKFKSHLPSPDPTALIDSSTGQRVFYSEFTRRVHSLAGYLQNVTKLSKNDAAFVLCPNSVHVPVLNFSLLSLGVVVSPGNPVSTKPEISRLIELCKPTIAFATSATAHKLPKLKHPPILLDSPEFYSMLTCRESPDRNKAKVSQSDVAAIMYSSGTTGKVKGVLITHRSLIATVAGFFLGNYQIEERDSQVVMLYTVPFFHMYGFFYSLKSVARGEALVVMERFELGKLLRAVEEFKVTNVAAAPPVVVLMAKSEVTDRYDLRLLEWVGCGGAPLGKDVVAAFSSKFPSVVLSQGYGLTESGGVSFRSMCREESLRWGAAGRLMWGVEVKIVDPDTGDALSHGKQGELWIRGPSIMKGYVGDPAATAATLTVNGWLKTGDLCYIDDEGFLFVVDRLKELIKYKGYQVSPAELEHLLQSHPEIADAAVIGFPDEEAGQVPMAFVVRKPEGSSLNERDIMEFIAKQVAPYKKIRRVAFVSSIPKSAAGKILRKDLRKMVLLQPPSSKL